MFERFTDRARRAIVLALTAATELWHHDIGTEHLLIGLAASDDSIAASVLRSSGLSADRIRRQVEAAVGRGAQAPSSHLPFTAPAKRTLELGLAAADELGQSQVSTGHLLLGVLRQADEAGATTLRDLGRPRRPDRASVDGDQRSAVMASARFALVHAPFATGPELFAQFELLQLAGCRAR